MAKILKAKMSLKTSFKRNMKKQSLDLRQQPLPCQARKCKLKISRTKNVHQGSSREGFTYIYLGSALYSIFWCQESPLLSKLWAKEISGENANFRPGRQERKVAITLPRASVTTSLTDTKRRKTLTEVFQLLCIEFTWALLLHH